MSDNGCEWSFGINFVYFKWCVSSARLEYRTVTAKVTGSNPVRTAKIMTVEFWEFVDGGNVDNALE